LYVFCLAVQGVNCSLLFFVTDLLKGASCFVLLSCLRCAFRRHATFTVGGPSPFFPSCASFACMRHAWRARLPRHAPPDPTFPRRALAATRNRVRNGMDQQSTPALIKESAERNKQPRGGALCGGIKLPKIRRSYFDFDRIQLRRLSCRKLLKMCQTIAKIIFPIRSSRPADRIWNLLQSSPILADPEKNNLQSAQLLIG